MTNKKRMYKYTSIISMAIVLMLIGNLILPMFTLAEGEEDTNSSSECSYSFSDESTFTMKSILTRDVIDNSRLSDKLKVKFESTYNGDVSINPISISLYWNFTTQDEYTIADINSDLDKIQRNEDVEEVFGKITNFILDNSDETVDNINIGETYEPQEPRQIDELGYYYIIALAKTKETTEGGEQIDKYIGVNICRIHVETLDYTDPDDPSSVTLQSISVKTEPSKTTYNEGEAIDLSGLVLTAKYSDGREEDVDMSSGKISLNSSATANSADNTVTVAYEGKEASFGITVNKPSEETLTIKANPEKTVYTQGEKIDLTGGKLLLTLNSGDFIEIDMTDAEVKLKSSETADVSNASVTLEYKGKEVSFSITVNPVEEKPQEPIQEEEKPAEEKPAEEKPAEQKPAEEKPVEQKPAEQKPATQNQTEVKTVTKNNNTQNVNPNKATEKMPQTGSNNTPVIIAIVLFSILGTVNFIKYKTAR